MTEGVGLSRGCLEDCVSEIRETLDWLVREANVDRALSGEAGAVEQRKLAVIKAEKLMDAIRRAYSEAEAAGLLSSALTELKDKALNDVARYHDVLSSSELSAARALHVSQDELMKAADSVRKLVKFLSSGHREAGEFNFFEQTQEEPPLIRKILELKEKARRLEEENRRLKEELKGVKGRGDFFLEPFEGEHSGLLGELEELRKENKELRRQVDELRRGAEVTAYQSLLEENNALKQRTERLLEALRAMRRRYEERLQELMREKDEWRSKAMERTVKTIEDTMLELRSQVESLKRENKELKERLGIIPAKKDESEKEYELYFS